MCIRDRSRPAACGGVDPSARDGPRCVVPLWSAPGRAHSRRLAPGAQRAGMGLVAWSRTNPTPPLDARGSSLRPRRRPRTCARSVRGPPASTNCRGATTRLSGQRAAAVGPTAHRTHRATP
eukprot:4877456-Prymnesium_polylepis.1